MSQTLVLIGSGPGIGISVASLFASREFDTIALLSRNAERLSSDREAILKAAGNAGRKVDVKTFAVDTATPAFETTLNEVAELGNISCVVFNPARVGADTLFEMEEEQMLKDYQTTNIGCYKTAKWALPILSKVKDANPALLITSSLFAIDPMPQFFGLLMVKAAQRSLVKSIQKVYGKDVHIAMVNVNGVVSPDDPKLNPDLIAEKFWGLYEQEKGKWADQVNVPEGSEAMFEKSSIEI